MADPFIIPTNEAEWHGARSKGLGASDAAAAVGISPWKSNVRLWEEKCGLRKPDDLSGNPAVERGKALEPIVRAAFAIDHPEYEVEYRGAWDMVRRADEPWYLATLDGRLTERATGRKGVFEAKTAALNSRQAAEAWAGRVPPSYLAQVLHQFNATGWDFVVLVAYVEDKDDRIAQTHSTRFYHFERADWTDQMAWLLRGERAFWKCVETRTEPALIIPAA